MKKRIRSTEKRTYAKTVISLCLSILLIGTAFVIPYPVTASAEPAGNENSSGSNENAVPPSNGNVNTAPDTDSPPENTVYDENTSKTPWEDKAPSSDAAQKSENEILGVINSQMVANSGLTEAELEELRGKINEREEELKKLNAEITDLKDSLHTRQKEVDSMTKLIESKSKEITELDADIKEMESNIESNRVLLGYYISESYKFEMNGFEELFNVVFGNNSLQEVVKKLNFWGDIQEKQADVTQKLVSQENELQDKKATAASSKSIVEQSKIDIIGANEALETSSNAYNEKMASVQADIMLLKGQQVLEQEGYLKQIYSSLLVTPPNMTEAEARLRANIVKDAMSCLGTMYVWGGESWEEGGFDCSGLCYYAYIQNGIKLPRVACDQFMGTPKIAFEDLRPGDMIYQGSTPSNIYHVMMYIGDGLTIEAPNFGEVVQIRPLAGRSGIYGYSSPLAAYSFK